MKKSAFQKLRSLRLTLLFSILLYVFLLLSTYITLQIAIFGSLVAYLAYPVYSRLNACIPRFASSLILVIMYCALLMPLSIPFLMEKEILFYMQFFKQISSETLGENIKNFEMRICPIMPDIFLDTCNNAFHSIPQKLALLAGNVLKYILDGINSITKVLFVAALIPIFAITVIKNLQFCKNILKILFTPNVFLYYSRYAVEANKIFYSFIYAHIVFALIYFVYFFASLSLIGVRGALFLSTAASILTFVPLLGQLISVFLIILSTLISSGISEALVQVIFVIAFMQVIDILYITPKILGESIGINSVLTMMIIIVASTYGSVIVVLLSLPLASLVHYIIHDLVARIKTTKIEHVVCDYNL